jgi:hypothetical protein
VARVAVSPLPESVTSGQIARATGLSERTINGRKSDGKLPVHKDGGVALYPVIKAGAEALAAGIGDGLDANRARESRLRGDRLELLNAQIRADLVPADEMENAVGSAFDAVRNRMLALPSRAAPLLLGAKTVADIQEILTELVHDACGDLAATDAVGTIKDRTRRRAGRSAGDFEDAAEASAAAEAVAESVGGPI